jgi:hypothetical protein
MSTPTTQVFLSSILLLEEWPQRILPSATITFFDNNGQQFLSIEDIYISKQHADSHPLISPVNYDMGDLLFGTLQHFTTTPPTIVATALCRHIMGQVDAGQVYLFPRPPWVMQMLHFLGTLLGATIYVARYTHEPMEGLGTNNYYISSYFSSCHYYFQFSDYHIGTMGQQTTTRGRQRLGNDSTRGHANPRRGSDVIHLMEGLEGA